jgi:uncharacterized PurR-regulated membrane protein YhhQ (DUF165 family)
LAFSIFHQGDLINEYFGKKAAKQTVYLGLAMSILAFIVINLAQGLPYLDVRMHIFHSPRTHPSTSDLSLTGTTAGIEAIPV